MPLTALVRQLQQVPLTGEVLERSRRPDRLRLQGASRGARALLASAMARCEALLCWWWCPPWKRPAAGRPCWS